MICTHDIAALLPFHSAGTLGQADRHAVEAHLRVCPACRAEVALWADVFLAVCADNEAMPAVASAAVERAVATARHREVPLHVQAWSLLHAQVPLVRRSIWVASALVMALGCAVAWLVGRSVAFTALAPLIAAVGVSNIYGPGNDPAFELALSTPTSPRQVLLARLVLVFGYDLALALAASVVLVAFEPALWLGTIVSQWLAPMTCLAALALVLSLAVGSNGAVGVAFSLWLMRGISPEIPMPTPVLGLIAVYQQVWRSSDWLLAVASVCLLASLWMAGRQTGRLAEG